MSDDKCPFLYDDYMCSIPEHGECCPEAYDFKNKDGTEAKCDYPDSVRALRTFPHMVKKLEELKEQADESWSETAWWYSDQIQEVLDLIDSEKSPPDQRALWNAMSRRPWEYEETRELLKRYPLDGPPPRARVLERQFLRCSYYRSLSAVVQHWQALKKKSLCLDETQQKQIDILHNANQSAAKIAKILGVSKLAVENLLENP